MKSTFHLANSLPYFIFVALQLCLHSENSCITNATFVVIFFHLQRESIHGGISTLLKMRFHHTVLLFPDSPFYPVSLSVLSLDAGESSFLVVTRLRLSTTFIKQQFVIICFAMLFVVIIKM